MAGCYLQKDGKRHTTLIGSLYLDKLYEINRRHQWQYDSVILLRDYNTGICEICNKKKITKLIWNFFVSYTALKSYRNLNHRLK